MCPLSLLRVPGGQARERKEKVALRAEGLGKMVMEGKSLAV